MSTSSTPRRDWFALVTALLVTACGASFAVGLSGCPMWPTKSAGVALAPPQTKQLSPNLTLETVGDQKRVLITARVCLRQLKEIGLECLVCGAGKKEHESILATEADGEAIHQALVDLGAKPGSPPVYEWFETPKGAPSKVVLKYEQAGKVTTVPMKWMAPAETNLRLYVEYMKGETIQYVPPTMEAPAGVTLRATLEYTQDGKFSNLPKAEFEAPSGPPIKISLEYRQGDNVTPAPPPYTPAHGTPVKISLRYEQDGKLHTIPASKWIRNGRTGKELEHDWVFAGSLTVPNPLNPGGPARYLAADEGSLICVCDVPTSLLSLPVWSPKGQGDRFYEPITERIPPEGTPVTVILELVLDK